MSKKSLLTFEDDEYDFIAKLATAARLKFATFCKVKIMTGEYPLQVPPLVSELSGDMLELIKICHAGRSNLGQLGDHAARLGGPLTHLTGPDGPLSQMSKQLLKIGVDTKGGLTDDSKSTAILLTLKPASELLNELARSLNVDEKSVPLSNWKTALEALLQAIQAVKLDAVL